MARHGASAAPGAPTKRRDPALQGDPAERAREICLRLLADRPRTRAELATALRKKGIADAVVAEVLRRYGEVGIVDDEAFARAWITSRHHGRGLARRALAGELHRKGVESDMVGAALNELAPETEIETARGLVERRLRSEPSGPPDVVFRRLVGMLARKGYPPSLAFRVVKEALDRRSSDDDRTDEGVLDDDAIEAAIYAAELQEAEGNEP